jgi:hypothetical protein
MAIKDVVMNIVAKYLGAETALNFLDGKKAYLGGGGLVLIGAGMIALDAVPALASKDMAKIVAFASTLATHPGTQKVLEGVGILGLRHAVAKSAPEGV